MPELPGLLQVAVEAERATARLVEQLIVAEDADLAGAATGVPLEQWLAIVARSTRSERRMLSTAAQVCRRLPSLRSAFAGGEVSWSQVRAVALRIERAPRHLDDRLDAAVGRAIAGAADADPDALARVVGWALAELQTPDQPDDEADEQVTAERDVLVLQPRLDGTGGTVWGDLGPVSFAAARNPTGGPPPRPPTGSGPGTTPAPA